MPGIIGGLLSIFASAGLAQTDTSAFDHGTTQAGYQTAALFITIGESFSLPLTLTLTLTLTPLMLLLVVVT